MTDINIKARKIAADWQGIGVEGDNGVEQYRFVIDRFTGNSTDLYEGIATAIFRLPDGTEGFSKLDMELLDEKRIALMWEIGSEVTQQPGTVLVSIRISGLENRLWNSEIGRFTVARTLSEPSSQPTRLMARKAQARIADPTQENPITVVERTIMIPAELQNIAVQNDENSEDVTIVLPRYFDGFDLSEHNIYLRTVNDGGRDDILFTGNNKSVVSNEIHLNWMLKPPQTSYNGRLSIQIVVKGENFQWSSASASITIIQLIDGDPVIPNAPSMYDIWIEELDELREVALAGIDQAKDQALQEIDAAKADAKDEIVTEVSKSFLPVTGGKMTGSIGFNPKTRGNNEQNYTVSNDVTFYDDNDNKDAIAIRGRFQDATEEGGTTPRGVLEILNKHDNVWANRTIIRNVDMPELPYDSSNKKYVDEHVPDLSGYVAKTGTQVVEGDLQVPTPLTAESVVNRGYADGNGYAQALKDTLPNTVPESIYKNGWRYAPITKLVNSSVVNDNNKYCLMFTLSKGNSAYRFWGAFGQYQFTKSIDLVIFQQSNNTITINNFSPMPLNDNAMTIVISKDDNNHYIYAKKKTIQWAMAQIQCQQYLSQTAVRASDTSEWIDAPIGTEIWNSDDQTTPGLVPKDYADSVPYQYAKSAGFPYTENIFKRSIKRFPFEFTFTYNGLSTSGYQLIAKSNVTFSTAANTNLIIEGFARAWGSTNRCKIVINNQSANKISFAGIGDSALVVDLNIVVVTNSENKVEVYLQKETTAARWYQINLKISVEGQESQWTVNPALETFTLTSGTIPGTKVWDLKTAWGTTSRTQVIKEDVCADNAGAHNAIYRGKNLGTSVTAAQYAAIADGTFKDLFIGDYWVIDGVRWYIAHIDYYKNVRAKKIHHLLIVPGGTIGSAKMNSTATTINGYWGSEMRSTNILPALEKIKGIFGNYIMPHDIIMPAKSDSNGQVTKEEWVTVSIGALMNAYMVFGFNPQYIRNNDPVRSTICEPGQLALFRYSIEQLWIGAAWWLRDISSGTNFVNVHVTNCVSTDLANMHSGIRPYFCLAGTPQTQTAANSIPTAAPSLEISSEEEEEITV